MVGTDSVKVVTAPSDTGGSKGDSTKYDVHAESFSSKVGRAGRRRVTWGLDTIGHQHQYESRNKDNISCASVNVDATLLLLSHEEREKYAALFQALNTDSSGSLAVEELHAQREILGIESDSLIMVEDLVSLVNSVGDGEILASEFTVLMHIVCAGEDSPYLVYLPGHGPHNTVNSSSASHLAHSKGDASLQSELWLMLEDPSSSQAAMIIGVILLFVVLISVTAFCIGTMEKVVRNLWWETALGYIELGCTSVFSLELVLRLASTPHPVRFFFNWLNLVDIASLLPYYLELVIQDTSDSAALRVVRLFRVTRMFKLSRYVTWLRLYGDALRKARFPLIMALLVCMIYVTIFASLVFFVEKSTFDYTTGVYLNEEGDPADFQNVFDGMYFAIISITTVGYGDKQLHTNLGMAAGACGLLCGILIFAIPISIFSTHFQIEYNEFTKTQQRQQQRVREMNRMHRNETTKKRIAHVNRMTLEAAHKGIATQATTTTGVLPKIINNSTKSEQAQRISTNSTTKREGPLLCNCLRARHKIAPWKSRSMGSSQASSQASSLPRNSNSRASKREYSSIVALSRGLAAIDAAGITSLIKRQALRRTLLREQIQRVVDLRREKLWAAFRVLERKHREKLMIATLEKYTVWFLRSDEQLEQEIVNAVLKIQAAFRGGMARIVMSAKLSNMANRAKRNFVCFAEPVEANLDC